MTLHLVGHLFNPDNDCSAKKQSRGPRFSAIGCNNQRAQLNIGIVYAQTIETYSLGGTIGFSPGYASIEPGHGNSLFLSKIC